MRKMLKKTLSLLMTLCMAVTMLPMTTWAEAARHAGCTGEGQYCLVCDIADKINALPNPENITVENVAAVIDQVHAIDRIKVNLDIIEDADGNEIDQYEALLTLIETVPPASGIGYPVPAKYADTVAKIREFGGNSLYVQKSFQSFDGREVDVYDAEVLFSLERLDVLTPVEPLILTMSMMGGNMPDSLSTDADFYSMNVDENGWTYKYILPAGRYRLKEISDSGAKIGEENFVTGSVSYDVNGGERIKSEEGIVFTVQEDEDYHISVLNTYSPIIQLEFQDQGGNHINNWDGLSVILNNVNGINQQVTLDKENPSIDIISDGIFSAELKGNPPDGYSKPSVNNCFIEIDNTNKTAKFVALLGNNYQECNDPDGWGIMENQGADGRANIITITLSRQIPVDGNGDGDTDGDASENDRKVSALDQDRDGIYTDDADGNGDYTEGDAGNKNYVPVDVNGDGNTDHYVPDDLLMDTNGTTNTELDGLYTPNGDPDSPYVYVPIKDDSDEIKSFIKVTDSNNDGVYGVDDGAGSEKSGGDQYLPDQDSDAEAEKVTKELDGSYVDDQDTPNDSTDDSIYIPKPNSPGDFINVKKNIDGSYTDENNTPSDTTDDTTYIPTSDGFKEAEKQDDGRTYKTRDDNKQYEPDGNDADVYFDEVTSNNNNNDNNNNNNNNNNNQNNGYIGGRGNGSSNKYNITINVSGNGDISSSNRTAKKGTAVTLTTEPDEGYNLNSLKAVDRNGKEIKLTDNGDGTYSFEMPRSSVTVTGVFGDAAEDAEIDIAELDLNTAIVLKINDTVTRVFGEYIVNDVPPTIRNARTMLPIRFIVEGLGGTVAWDEAAQSVTILKGDTVIEIMIGQTYALVNGERVALDSPAFIENDRTYLPLRFVAENLGAIVLWDGDTQQIYIIPNVE